MSFTECRRRLAVCRAALAGRIPGTDDTRVPDAAVVVLDNESCDVLALVGSTDWWTASCNLTIRLPLAAR